MFTGSLLREADHQEGGEVDLREGYGIVQDQGGKLHVDIVVENEGIGLLPILQENGWYRRATEHLARG